METPTNENNSNNGTNSTSHNMHHFMEMGMDVHKVVLPPYRSTFQKLKAKLKEILFPDDPLHQFKGQTSKQKWILGAQYVFPILEWGPSYSFKLFKSDIVAGLTIASLAIPQVTITLYEFLASRFSFRLLLILFNNFRESVMLSWLIYLPLWAYVSDKLVIGWCFYILHVGRVLIDGLKNRVNHCDFRCRFKLCSSFVVCCFGKLEGPCSRACFYCFTDNGINAYGRSISH